MKNKDQKNYRENSICRNKNIKFEKNINNCKKFNSSYDNNSKNIKVIKKIKIGKHGLKRNSSEFNIFK